MLVRLIVGFFLGVFVFNYSTAMVKSRQIIELSDNFPESPLVHTYNGIMSAVNTKCNIKLVSQAELRGKSLDQFVRSYYPNIPGYFFYAKAPKIAIDVDISKFRKIFCIPNSGNSYPEFYITVLSCSQVVSDPYGTGDTTSLFRPHWSYYHPEYIGPGKARKFVKKYGTGCFSFFDEYCKTRTCYFDKYDKITFSNQCWGARGLQDFSIHTDNSNAVRFSNNTPSISAVCRNASANRSCAVFYASKLPEGLEKPAREIYGLILILNDADLESFQLNKSSKGLPFALSNDLVLKKSNTALQIFPGLW